MFTYVKFQNNTFVNEIIIMTVDTIIKAYPHYKETSISHRYITYEHIAPLLKNLKTSFKIETIGTSVLGLPIDSVTIGTGKKKLLLWSQMHGNETTTTKALFDLFNVLKTSNAFAEHILKHCTLKVIPILNPDGAQAYTRLNANTIDLNRDAQALTQPESKLLRSCFNTFKPDFCFNLHGQRTIFSAGDHNQSAIVSFLSPAEDEKRSLTPTRTVAMALISKMNKTLQKVIPKGVGVYDDSFNINCVGDTFQSLGVPTVLFEAGHYPGDYAREETRKLIFMALVAGLNYIASKAPIGMPYKTYLDIPENKKRFYDIIIRNATHNNRKVDIAIQYQERLEHKKVIFIPKIEKISNLESYYAHNEINACGHAVFTPEKQPLQVGDENVFVLINNEKTPLVVEKNILFR